MKFVHWFVQILLASPKFPGRDFLIERIPRWFLKKPHGPQIIQTRFGFKIKVNPDVDKNIENVIYERGVYEQGTVHLLQSLLKPGDYFVDVGANIGFLSLVAAVCVGEQGEVIAFEPVPTTMDILNANKRLNGFERLNTEPYALGNEQGSLMIYQEEMNRGGASLAIKRSEDIGIAVDVKRMDDLVLAYPVSLIKIDVEGFEFEVLKGGAELIKRDQPILVIEFSADRKEENDAFEMYEWLQDLGIYTVHKLKKGKERKSKLVPVNSKNELPKHDNIICLPIKN